MRQDLDLKIRAFTHTSRRTARTDADSPDQPQALIKALQDATTTEVTDLFLLAEQIWSSLRDAQPTPLTEFSAEAACYLLFCQVVTEIFSRDFGQAKLARVAGKLGVDQPEGAAVVLATARRHMAIDTTLAWNVLVDVRIALGTVVANR